MVTLSRDEEFAELFDIDETSEQRFARRKYHTGSPVSVQDELEDIEDSIEAVLDDYGVDPDTRDEEKLPGNFVGGFLWDDGSSGIDLFDTDYSGEVAVHLTFMKTSASDMADPVPMYRDLMETIEQGMEEHFDSYAFEDIHS